MSLTFLVLMHILTFLFFLLDHSLNFLDPFFLLVEMLSEPKKGGQCIYHHLKTRLSATSKHYLFLYR